MEGETTVKNVQKGARFKIQRENEERMFVRLASPERGKMRASVIIYFAASKLFQITRQCLERASNINNTSLNL